MDSTLPICHYDVCSDNCNFTQLSIPTHAQLQRHRLIFIKNHLKKLLHVSVYDHLQGVYNVLAQITIILTTFGFMLSVVMWQHVVLFVSGCT